VTAEGEATEGLPDDLVRALRARLPFELATEAAVRELEEALAGPLPGPLRDFYLRVANGSDDFMGLAGGGVPFDGMTVPELYRSYMQDDPDAPPGDEPWWRPGVVPLYYWGCIVFTAVDCSTPDARVVGHDEGTWIPDGRPLAEWLTAWLDDAVYQPGCGPGDC
jgi:hypothetical protein